MLKTKIVIFYALISFGVKAQTFEEVAIPMGLPTQGYDGYLGGGVSFVDINDDGWDDLSLATELDQKPVFLLNDGTRFSEIILKGVEVTCESKSLLWIDIENDGDLDLVITCFEESNQLYRNDGNLKFTNISIEAGLLQEESESFGVTGGDVNKDGLVDLYVITRSIVNINRFYLNQGNTDFLEYTNESATNNGSRFDFCASFIDFDKDGNQDLYISSDYTHPNTLYKNEGLIPLSDVSASTRSDIEIAAMNVGPGDFDNDLDEDIYVTNIPAGNELLINDIDTFRLADSSLGLGFYRTGWAGNWLDFDNDGWLDLYVSAMQDNFAEPNALYHNHEGTDFSEPFRNTGGILGIDTARTFSNAIGDHNNDGKLDIVTYNAKPYRPYLLENQEPENNYLKVFLEGTVSNRNAIGSTIYLHYDGKTIMRYVHAGEGYLNQNSYHQHFGIGDSNIIDSLTVEWLNGLTDTYYNLQANQFLHLIEGTSNEFPVPCKVTEYVKDPIDVNTSIIRSKSVMVGSTVDQAELNIKAGNAIIFKPDFELSAGSLLTARIGSCQE